MQDLMFLGLIVLGYGLLHALVLAFARLGRLE